MKKYINKPSYLTIIGLLVFLGAFAIGGLILFPLAAILLGENLLEGEAGNLTIIGGAVVYFPYLLASCIIVYDLFIRKPKTSTPSKFPYKKIGFASIILGAIVALIGVISLLTYDQDKGANIGAGMLIFAGGLFILVGLFILTFRLIYATLRKKF